ncbi:DUF4406 domain-containing protein [uncultured Desulfovibrio sp.]|uniref:DUF4406 domain-containing protein n=1 Tax=uncultured Desulfovibrio sp. TaxID=167968 RepID=UPI0026347B08|nr:DUF4406 domain-containing protein [uncultured Desulfovibrio sp.]
MTIYLSGPMSGLPENNYPAFHAAAASLRRRGLRVENPAENTAPPDESWQGYMRLALVQLARCDAVALLPGWRQSRGARLEHCIARRLGLDVRPLAAFADPAAPGEDA